MSQEEMNNLFGGFEKMAKQMQDAVVDSWSGMTKQAVGSDGFSAASSAYLDWTLSSQKQMRSNSAQFLDALEFPKRSDIARISKQISNAETRIADCEDTLDKILKILQRLEGKIDAGAPQKADPAPKAAPAPQPVAVAAPPVVKSVAVHQEAPPVVESVAVHQEAPPVVESVAVHQEAPSAVEPAPAKAGRKSKLATAVEIAPESVEESKPKSARAKKHSAIVAKNSARARKPK